MGRLFSHNLPFIFFTDNPDQAFSYYRHPDQALARGRISALFSVPRTSRGTNIVTLSVVEGSRLYFCTK